jgi:ABC-type multidrug transport system ATPase subunit
VTTAARGASSTASARTGGAVRGLRVRDTSSGADRDIVAGLDVDLGPGRRIGVTGPSSGDVTAVLATVAGLRPPANGTITVDGDPVGVEPSPLRVTYLSQDHRLIGTLTAVENVLVTMLAGDLPGNRESVRRAEEQLEALALAPATWHNLVEQLSGGQQQRVALGRALVLRSSLLVLDHPTSELDPDSVVLVDEVLGAVQNEGCAVLLASSDDVLLQRCDALITVG